MCYNINNKYNNNTIDTVYTVYAVNTLNAVNTVYMYLQNHFPQYCFNTYGMPTWKYKVIKKLLFKKRTYSVIR